MTDTEPIFTRQQRPTMPRIAETRNKIQRLAPGGGFILATSNSITDYCKVENILAMLETKEKFGIYPILQCATAIEMESGLKKP